MSNERLLVEWDESLHKSKDWYVGCFDCENREGNSGSHWCKCQERIKKIVPETILNDVKEYWEQKQFYREDIYPIIYYPNEKLFKICTDLSWKCDWYKEKEKSGWERERKEINSILDNRRKEKKETKIEKDDNLFWWVSVPIVILITFIIVFLIRTMIH